MFVLYVFSFSARNRENYAWSIFLEVEVPRAALFTTRKENDFLWCSFLLFCPYGLNILVVGENTLIFIHLSNCYYSVKTNRNELALWIDHVTLVVFILTWMDWEKCMRESGGSWASSLAHGIFMNLILSKSLFHHWILSPKSDKMFSNWHGFYCLSKYAANDRQFLHSLSLSHAGPFEWLAVLRELSNTVQTTFCNFR